MLFNLLLPRLLLHLCLLYNLFQLSHQFLSPLELLLMVQLLTVNQLLQLFNRTWVRLCHFLVGILSQNLSLRSLLCLLQILVFLLEERESGLLLLANALEILNLDTHLGHFVLQLLSYLSFIRQQFLQLVRHILSLVQV